MSGFEIIASYGLGLITGIYIGWLLWRRLPIVIGYRH
jgi:hypothetical protein